MEFAPLVSISWLSSAQLLEIFASFGCGTAVKAEFDSSGTGTINGNIKVDGVSDFGILLAKEALKETTNHGQLGCHRSRGWDDNRRNKGMDGCNPQCQGEKGKYCLHSSLLS